MDWGPTTIAVAALLGAWCALTVAAQFPDVRRRVVAPIDFFGLIPLWTFFAPNPGTSDFHLLYRHRLVGGSIGSWREVQGPRNRSLRKAFWNPEKKAGKAIVDMVMDLARMVEYREPSYLPLTIPYVALLNTVSAEPYSELSDAVQFVIIETFGYDEGRQPPAVRALSGFHRL